MYLNTITSFTYSDVLKSVYVVKASSNVKALLSSFAYVWALVLYQHLPKLNEETAHKWKKSSDNYQREVLELRSKLSSLSHLKEKVRNAHKNISKISKGL